MTGFKKITDIQALRNNQGQVIKNYPFEKIKNKDSFIPNKHGMNWFCFLCKISNKYLGYRGVYLIIVSNKLKYVGCTIRFAERWIEYCTIYPRKIWLDGQSTNCKINHNLGVELDKGHKAELYFCQTENYKDFEKFLRKEFKPDWNSQ